MCTPSVPPFAALVQCINEHEKPSCNHLLAFQDLNTFSCQELCLESSKPLETPGLRSRVPTHPLHFNTLARSLGLLNPNSTTTVSQISITQALTALKVDLRHIGCRLAKCCKAVSHLSLSSRSYLERKRRADITWKKHISCSSSRSYSLHVASLWANVPLEASSLQVPFHSRILPVLCSDMHIARSVGATSKERNRLSFFC
jgi:hypothetical protein